jgi:hypothetical protein
MKRFFKPIMLALLILISAVLIVVPTTVQIAEAGGIEHFPGRTGEGPYGLTCYCPLIFYVDCGCAFAPPEP